MSNIETPPQEKVDPKGRFDSDLTGVLKTVNVNDWGIRGILVTESGEIIFVITYDKTPKDSIPILSKGDTVLLSRVWISTYTGKIIKWQGKDQAKLCAKAPIKLLKKAEAPEVYQPENSSKAIVSNVEMFENLQRKIKETQEDLEQLEKIASLQDSVAISPKDFLRATTKATLAFHRMLCATLMILEKEE